MATLSTHLLNSIDGTHAGNVGLSVIKIAGDDSRTVILTSATDAGGRFKEEIALGDADTACTFELVIDSAAYFDRQQQTPTTPRIIAQLVVRFHMPDSAGAYHIPLMIAPNSYSVWWSS